jgi:hypothetical protein
MYKAAFIVSTALVCQALAAYEKVWDYNASNFFDNFNFIDVSIVKDPY